MFDIVISIILNVIIFACGLYVGYLEGCIRTDLKWKKRLSEND